MKTLLLVSSLLCICLGVVAVAQDSANAAPLRHQVAGLRLTSIMGTVREGDKLTFVTDRRACNLDNPEMLKGYEGHYVPSECSGLSLWQTCLAGLKPRNA